MCLSDNNIKNYYRPTVDIILNLQICTVHTNNRIEQKLSSKALWYYKDISTASPFNKLMLI